ncbi:MAG TPA: UDP-N-acetylglucosamine 2-epimerase (non-hydrolyzing) [Candidatus Limnocylindrales bacterium]|nr:UDP-N-acetylglucosamine 2-epimerase (non-hydrolyzing) [Candidatus Limnocylindrales bacterium]
MRIVSVVGTRPQLIKAAALWPSLRARHEEVFVDTGQHWDEPLAGAFFEELGLPRPDHSLGVGGGTSAQQLGRMLPALADVLAAERPEAVLVYGDTNSTLAGALAASSLGIPVAHVEAGLRSFDRGMPEETNRVLTDHIARWLFAPTPAGVANLAAEGITDGVHHVGDVMQDLAAHIAPTLRDRAVLQPIADRLGVSLEPGRYLFATIHRAENRVPAAVRAWTALLDSVASEERPVVLALHPGTRAALSTAGVPLEPPVVVVEPQPYASTLALQLHAAAVLTDSGGIQRESSWLRVPCLVLRMTTEWVEAVAGSGGSMVVIGVDGTAARAELERLAPQDRAPALAAERAASLEVAPAGAVDRIAAVLEAGE